MEQWQSHSPEDLGSPRIGAKLQLSYHFGVLPLGPIHIGYSAISVISLLIGAVTGSRLGPAERHEVRWRAGKGYVEWVMEPHFRSCPHCQEI